MVKRNEFKDLTTKKNTVTFHVTNEFGNLKAYFEDDSIDVVTYKKLASDVVNKAAVTNGQKRIFNTLQTKKTKFDILNYLLNVTLAGSGRGVLKD